MGVKASVAGSHSSARNTGVVALLNPGPLVPPVTSTFPSGSTVVFICLRATLIDPTARHAGLPAFRLMISAVLVGGSAPPKVRIFPGSYITAPP